MKPVILFKQGGAVLAFTMVMLLLLTLVGVSMIQQNKQQLTMAGNTRQQNQVFANVESGLAMGAEPYIACERLSDKKTQGICNTPAMPTPPNHLSFDDPTQTLPLNLPLADGDPICNALMNIPNVSSKITEVYCFTNGDTVFRCSPQDDPLSNGCEAWYDRKNSCKAEIYTIETTATDALGTQRKIESKYAVDCSKYL